MQVAKKMISIRMDEELIKLLETVSTKNNSMFYDRDRTWLIEHAIKETYEQDQKTKPEIAEVTAPT